MDPIIHTLIATIMLAGAFYIGRYFGKESGILYTWGTILEAFDAKEVEIDEEGALTVTYNDGTKETLN